MCEDESPAMFSSPPVTDVFLVELTCDQDSGMDDSVEASRGNPYLREHQSPNKFDIGDVALV